jgi:hypothetical protein
MVDLLTEIYDDPLHYFLTMLEPYTTSFIHAPGASFIVSHPVFKPKPNAHNICAQESNLHTYHTENGYRITNVSV